MDQVKNLNLPTSDSRLQDWPSLPYHGKSQGLADEELGQTRQALSLLNSLIQPEKNEEAKNTNQNLSSNEKKAKNDNKSFHERLRDSFYGGPKWFQIFRDKFTLSLNSFGIVFNFLAVIAKNSKIFSKESAEFLDKKSVSFSKNFVPLSFAWSGVEAYIGGRLPEAVSRLIPAIGFLILPFYNLNIATGISSGLNYLFELVRDRHDGKHPGENMAENCKEVVKTSLEIFKDMFKGKYKHEDFAKQFATIGMLGGSLGGFAFASQERTSLPARFFGNLRNFGGIAADWKLIFNNVKNDARRRFDLTLVGGLCSTASILNILMRWVNPELARTLNHIAIAVDDFGLTYWAHCSKKDNDRQEKLKQEKVQSSQELA